jgi:hypothetical protein
VLKPISKPSPESSRNVVLELSGTNRQDFPMPTGFPAFLPSPYHPSDGLNHVESLHSAWSVQLVRLYKTNSVWAMGVKIHFQRCETIQENPGYQANRYDFYFVYMCVARVLQVASIMLFSSYLCVWLFCVCFHCFIKLLLIVHVVFICTLSTFPREGVHFFKSYVGYTVT